MAAPAPAAGDAPRPGPAPPGASPGVRTGGRLGPDPRTVPAAVPRGGGGRAVRGLRAALGRIAPKQAEAFSLHALEGWSYAEIARHMGVTPDAVGVLLHRARHRLRRLLGATLEAPGATGPRKEPR